MCLTELNALRGEMYHRRKVISNKQILSAVKWLLMMVPRSDVVSGKSTRRKDVRNIVVHSNEPRLSAVKSSVVIVPRSEVVCGKVKS